MTTVLKIKDYEIDQDDQGFIVFQNGSGVIAFPTLDEAKTWVENQKAMDFYTPADFDTANLATPASIEKYNRAVKNAKTCKICGASSLDGATFTTLAGSNVCDDCI